MPNVPINKPMSESVVEQMLFRYLELENNLKDLEEEKSKHITEGVRKTRIENPGMDVSGNVFDKEVDVSFIEKYNHLDRQIVNAEGERHEIYETLYEWRFPRKDESFKWWIKAGRFTFRIDPTKRTIIIE